MTTASKKTTAAPNLPASGRYNFGQLEAIWILLGGAKAWAPTMAGVALAESGGNPNAINYDLNGSNKAYGSTPPPGWTPQTGTVDVGLWQINSVHIGSLTAPGMTTSEFISEMKNAATNAGAASALLGQSGSGISAWKGDTVGNYAQNGQPLSLGTVLGIVNANKLGSVADAIDPSQITTTWVHKIFPGGLASISKLLGSGAAGGVTPGLNIQFGGLTSLEHDLEVLVHDVTDVAWWTRVGEFLLGAALLIGGAILFVTSTSSKGAGGAVEDVAKTAVVA